ncbi:unnamed protein product [Lepeophtheirus salmonis]|uniref:(salmon louse) hypothetical protein n=1 Tax=Lepeophtheirus salmonis TaxID=72036 RepID=A0A7R8CFQ5_LEPSM|nr:unnamed protein product [Lepeophtheirus salmonis]CAF2768234.1 unnamed protein product [Lepeophtheirus salmonis]
MVKYCAAYGCSNLDKGSSTGRSFHRFPRDPKILPKEHRRGKKRRISSSLALEDDDHLSANTDILIVPPKIDHNRLISREHAYAFPSDITLAKIKYDNLESLFFQKHCQWGKKGPGTS